MGSQNLYGHIVFALNVKRLENGEFARVEQCARGRRFQSAVSGTLPVESLYALTIGGVATFLADVSFFPLQIRQVLIALPVGGKLLLKLNYGETLTPFFHRNRV